MADLNEGIGDAQDAQVDTAASAQTADLVAEARVSLAGAEARVEKQRAHLAESEQNLVDARNAVAELEGA